ncbi:hypothetical protein K7X08_006386 [Anisodus acutangulus]|uniref:Uncharacterized protein n=1 Tax=Anisodus acutangulus TaxID=402998 RepID=A0A9Q1MV85_9SOLA|nr:hypothetical protein K7X08_006386 [Anisodus acutangulus]
MEAPNSFSNTNLACSSFKAAMASSTGSDNFPWKIPTKKRSYKEKSNNKSSGDQEKQDFTKLVNSIVIPSRPDPTLVFNKNESVHLQPQKCQPKEVIVDKEKEHASQEEEMAAEKSRPVSNSNVVDTVGKYRVPDLNFPPPEKD